MSIFYAIENINNSFDTITRWFKEFMAKTEQAFQSFHQRLVYLEKRLDTSDRTALSDEQVERVMRKILAEKFAMQNDTPRSEPPEYLHHPKDGPDPRTHQLPGKGPLGGQYITIKDDFMPPTPISIDAETLKVDPQAVPSEAFGRDMEMLQQNLEPYPNLDGSKRAKNSRSSGSYDSRYNTPNKVHSNNAWA